MLRNSPTVSKLVKGCSFLWFFPLIQHLYASSYPFRSSYCIGFYFFRKNPYTFAIKPYVHGTRFWITCRSSHFCHLSHLSFVARIYIILTSHKSQVLLPSSNKGWGGIFYCSNSCFFFLSNSLCVIAPISISCLYFKISSATECWPLIG